MRKAVENNKMGVHQVKPREIYGWGTIARYQDQFRAGSFKSEDRKGLIANFNEALVEGELLSEAHIQELLGKLELFHVSLT